MNWLGRLPIKRKLNLIVMLTCLAVLVPMCVALVVYQIHDYRRALARDTTVLADVLARNSEAVLAFHDEDGASKTLQALEVEPGILGACLYDEQGALFAQYLQQGQELDFPAPAPAPANSFEANWLTVARPVTLNDKRIGSIYLVASLQGVHARLMWSMEIGIPVLLLCLLAALFVSSELQRPISQPILALAETAKRVAQRHDYSVRAPAQAGQEIGLLTDAFNLMLTQIQDQHRALNYERDLLNTLLDNLPDAIYFKDLQSRFVRLSKSKLESAFAFCESQYRASHPNGADQPLPEHLSSLPRFAAYLEGKSDADLFIEEDARLVHAEEQRIVRTGEPIIGKVERARMQDGSQVWLMSTKMAWRDKDGKIIGTFGSSKNITAIKEIEQKLQSQLERLKLLDQITRSIGERQDLHSIYQVVVGRLEDQSPVDFACVCSYNAAANTLSVSCVGARSDALAQSMSLTLQSGIDIDQNGLARCLRGQLVYEPDTAQAQVGFLQKLASAGLRSVVFAPLLMESQIFGILMAARREPQSFSSADCEFLKQLSEHVALAAHQAQLYTALQKAFDELRQTQQTVMQQERLRALGQMASGIAHDINNAISPVSLYTESLLETEPNLSARTRGYLQTIQRSIEDVAHTVARMREFYRQRESQLTATSVDANALVRQVIDLTRARWSDIPQQHGALIQLATELPPHLPVFSGVESEIREALVNLIFNAVDAMPDGGTLTLRTKIISGSNTTRRIAVEVSDTGVGMDEETRRRCLEPFFTTKGERGTGLGLAMVYGIVRRHGGDIAIESAAGRGTTFRLVFPVGAPVADASKPAAEPVVPARQRILIVDDDPVLIRSLRDILEGDGHLIVAAHGGQDGIEAFRGAKAKGETFAVVITDLGMPSVDGRQVAAAVKEASLSTPVIMLTGWGERLRVEGPMPAHVDEVLSKPPKLRDLRRALARCLSKSQEAPTYG